MPKNKDFALRIEIIDECLRNNYRKWTLDSLIDTVNEKLMDRHGKKASKRTIQNDLKYLKEEKFAPIKKKKDGAQTIFYYEDSNFSIKNLPIKNEDVGFLRDALHILHQVNDFKIIDDIEDVVSRLQNTIDSETFQTVPIIQFEKHSSTKGIEYIDDIYSAIKEKCALKVTYKTFKHDTSKTFIFYPYLIKEYRNRWFAIGRKNKTNYVTNLALDRIVEMKNSNSEFVTNNLFDPNTHFANVIGVTIPDNQSIEEIELKINGKQAPYVLTKPIHHSQHIITQFENGDVIVRMSLIINYELKSVLLGYGCDVEIIKPEVLRNEIISILNEAVSCYKCQSANTLH